jgi:hypothetical protein
MHDMVVPTNRTSTHGNVIFMYLHVYVSLSCLASGFVSVLHRIVMSSLNLLRLCQFGGTHSAAYGV